MSWQATAWAERQKTGSPARKVLLLVLANYADEHGVCWPSQETLKNGTEQSLDTVQRQLKKLEQIGLISIVMRPQGRGRWPGRTYKLNMLVAEKTEPQNAARPKAADEEGVNPDTNPIAKPQPGGDRAAMSTDHRAATSTVTEPQALRHEPSIESSSEPSVEPSPTRDAKTIAAERQQPYRRKRENVESIQNRIAQRLGSEGWLILGSIGETDLARLTAAEERGTLKQHTLENLRLLWRGTIAA